MKNSLFLLAGAAALSLASCSSNTTTETTSTTAPADSTGMATTTTTKTVSDETYHMRGNRMADRFAAKNKITDKATIAKLREAYYQRSKRYDELVNKYQADTAGMAAARRQYMMDNDKEFQTILVVPAQYQAYQSSQSDYDEANNMDTTDQSAAASSATMPATDSSSTTTTSTTTTSSSDMSGSSMGDGSMVEKGKSKMADGSKVKVKEDGTVKMKDADGNKTKM